MLSEMLASRAQPGPTGSQPTPVRSARAHPAAQVWPFASGLPPGESTAASLDAATFAGDRTGAEAAGQQYPARGGLCQGSSSWEAAKLPGVDKPVLSTPFPCFLSFRGGSQMFFLLLSGFSPFFSSLTSPGNPHLFSAEQVGCGSSYARFPGASTALAHTLPLPQEPSFFFLLFLLLSSRIQAASPP